MAEKTPVYFVSHGGVSACFSYCSVYLLYLPDTALHVTITTLISRPPTLLSPEIPRLSPSSPHLHLHFYP